MTLEEAQAEARADWHWIRSRMIAHDCGDPGEPSDTWLAIKTYEHLSGDWIQPSESALIERDPAFRLSLWSTKYREMRTVADPVLKSFLIDQINAARRGA